MKQKFRMVLYASAALSLFVAATITGCEKNQPVQEKVELVTESSNRSELVQYLMITMDVNKDEVTFDEKTREFVIKGVYHIKEDKVNHSYATANEYLFNHPKK